MQADCRYKSASSDLRGSRKCIQSGQSVGIMMVSLQVCLGLFVTFKISIAYNFQYESVQLTNGDVVNNPDAAFGQLPGGIRAQCKTFPGDSDWPALDRWHAFNSSLGGALLKAIPPAAACYSGIYENATKCAAWRQQSRSSLFV